MALGSNQQQGRRQGARAEFASATPIAVKRAAGHASALKLLSKIEARALALRERAIRHHKAFEDRWTAAEALRIWKRQLAQNAKYPAPPGVKQDVVPEAVMKLAAQSVRARTVRRLSTIKAIKTRMSNAVARNIDTPRLTQAFTIAAPSPGSDGSAPKKALRRTP